MAGRTKRASTGTGGGRGSLRLEALEPRVLLDGLVKAIGPDLIVSALAVPPGAAGATVQVDHTVRNQGNEGTGDDYKMSYYLSEDGAWDSGDRKIGTLSVMLPALGAGEDYPFSALLPLPGDVHGDYYLIAYVDWDGTAGLIAETNETNNTRATSLPITRPPVVDAPLPETSTNEDVPWSGSLAGAFSDPDGDSLTYSATSDQGANIAASVVGTAITVTPALNWTGTAAITVTANDGHGGTVEDTFELTVNPLPDPPDAVDDTATTAILTPVNIHVLINDADPDGDAIVLSGATQPAHGSVALNADGTVTYVPDVAFTGTDTFTYTITDNKDGSDTATVSVGVGLPGPSAADGYEQYLVELVNRARSDPGAEAALYGIALNEGLAAGTITDTPKQPLAINPYLMDSAEGHSQWMMDNASLTHAGAGGSQPDERMEDAGYVFVPPSSWGENIGVFQQKPDPPEPVSTTATLHEQLFVDSGVAGRGHRLNILKADFKEIGTGIVTGNWDSWKAVDCTEDFAYSAGNSFFTGVAYDDSLVTNNDFYTPGEQIPDVWIVATRQSDGAVYKTQTWDSGGYSLQVPAGTYTVVGINPALGGTVTHTGVVIGTENVKLDFTPEMAPSGPDLIVASVDAPSTADAGASVLVAWEVFNSGNAAAAGSWTDTIYLSDDPEITTSDTVLGSLGHTGPLGAGAGYTASTSVTLPSSGVFYIGVLTDSGAVVVEQSDANNGAADPGAITVGAGNDAPTAVDDTLTTDEDTPGMVNVLANDSDPEAQPLTVTGVTTPGHGTAVNNGDGTVTYTPAANYNGADTFSYTISDGHGGTDTADVSVTVTPVNDPPQPFDSLASVAEDGSVEVTLIAQDDSATLTYAIVTGPAHGTLSSAPGAADDAQWTYTPDADFNGQDTFTFTVSDGEYVSDPAMVTATVTPINDAPTAGVIATSTDEDTPIGIALDGSDVETPAGQLVYTIVTPPSHGAVALVGGTASYTPAAAYHGSDSFTYTVTDNGDPAGTHANPGDLTSAAATVTLTVNSVPDAPDAVDDSASTVTNTPVDVAVLANDSDDDGDPLTITDVGVPAHGTAVVNPDSTITYTPAAEFVGDDTFTYTITDGTGRTDTATVTVSVDEPGLWVLIGDAAAKQVSFTDAGGTVVTVSLKGGTANVHVLGDGLVKTEDNKGATVTGTNVTLADVALDDTTENSALTIKTKGGDGQATLGGITGDTAVGKLSAKTVILSGSGIAMTGNGVIGTIQLAEVASLTDIVMPGAFAKGVTLKVGDLGAGADVVLDNAGVKSLTATGWGGSGLEADWASKITIKGDMGADITLDGADASGSSLKTLSVSGSILGSEIDLAFDGGTIKATDWAGGSLSADFVKSISMKGDLDADIEAGELQTLSAKGTLGGSLSVDGNVKKISADSVLPGWSAAIGGELGGLTTKGDFGGSADDSVLSAASAKSISIKGDLEKARLTFTKDAAAGDYALSKLSVSGWMREAEVRSLGHVNSIASGGLDDVLLFAGVDASTTGLPSGVGEFVRESSIDSVSVKGIKDATYSTIGVDLAAWNVGKVSWANVQYANAGTPFGIAYHVLGSVQIKDPGETYKWPNSTEPDQPGDKPDLTFRKR